MKHLDEENAKRLADDGTNFFYGLLNAFLIILTVSVASYTAYCFLFT